MKTTHRMTASRLIRSLVICSLLVAGCDQPTAPNPVAPSVSNLKGSIKINGSSTSLLISNAVREAFLQRFPDVTVTVNGAGTGNGFDEFQSKQIDIADASRPIRPTELEKCKTHGVEFLELPVAYDGLTIVVHPQNDWVDALTVPQLKQLFVAEQAAKKWSDVDPRWPDQAIDLYAPGTGSGSYDYFREVVVGDSGQLLRRDMNLNEDDNVLVQGVAGNKYSIGFFGVAYYEESKQSLKAVKIVNPSDGVAYLPTADAIISGRYAPFSRPLFIYVSVASLRRVEVAAFVNFYLENVSWLCEKVAYVRLPQELLQRSIGNYHAKQTGTHYINSAGEVRSGALADVFLPTNLGQ
ncbi:PstS family phosphate ABC transporter substrate-binding protein [Stieleria sp. TO1_6]|uniref:PstS family phosphate ABC transporter substrate-binding protein n=1 Tax=Stieleria tagensis TaxID=2956795 RepID=UPI00209A85D2|nr:PstS family phosphate ABC transporter substrate-binding protein [Stieleria tagensis]MCO8120760.1 PstS family phosphate ABC transporter substrate-binding protein [Stieleria tagensis]